MSDLRQLTDDDVERFEADLEEQGIRADLENEYFAVDEYGVRRMTDPEYARLFRMRLQSALDLQRSNAGIELPGGPFVPPHAPSAAERGEWEKQYFAVNKAGERLVTVDAAHRARCEALRDRVFGTARRDTSGRVA